MTDHQSSPVTSEPLLVPEVVLQEARSLHRFYSEKPDKPYTSNVLADCIATIENLLSRIPDAAARTRDPEVVAAVQEAISKHPHFKGTSVTAFGFANTAIDAYTAASGVAQAVRNSVVEECAQVAEKFGVGRPRYDYGGTDIARAIRALAAQPSAAPVEMDANQLAAGTGPATRDGLSPERPIPLQCSSAGTGAAPNYPAGCGGQRLQCLRCGTVDAFGPVSEGK